MTRAAAQDPGFPTIDPAWQKISASDSRDPQRLVAILTKGKAGEKEKFDAIFAWVATRIKYNYYEYYSTGGSGIPNIRHILKSRYAICLGYANLMDTLCSLAGITNVTVYGYAKDDLFDVGDSIYTDNHAWNAVRLDGQWYLYDVTWSKGEKEYKLTRYSRFVLSLLQRGEKFRKKQFRRKIRHFFKNDCGKEYNGQAFYYRQRFINKIILHQLAWIVHRFPIKARMSYKEHLRLQYYLSDPDFFAITHFPDDPAWSLLPGKTMHAFECDSAYYSLNDSTGNNQSRTGRECVACDTYLGLDTLSQIRQLQHNSHVLNPRNRVIQSLCDYLQAETRIHEAMVHADSLSRLHLLDTAISNFQDARLQLQVAKKNAAMEAALHKKKNKRKQNLEVAENKRHLIMTKQHMKLTYRQIRNTKEVLNQSKAFSQAYRNRARQVSHMKTSWKEITLRTVPEKKINDLETKITRNDQKLDSLSAGIEKNKQSLDSLLEHLSLNIWPQALSNDSIIARFYTSIRMRRVKLDNYKKPLVDVRKKLDSLEFAYNNDIRFIIYTPSENIFQLFSTVNKYIRIKNQLQKENLNYKRQLARLQVLSQDELKQYKLDVLDNRKTDICWIEHDIPYISSVYWGLELLKAKEKHIGNLISFENVAERDRYVRIDHEIKRRYRKHNNIISNNNSVMLRFIKNTKQLKMNIIKPRKRPAKKIKS